MLLIVGLAVVSLSIAQLDGGSSALAVAIAKAQGAPVDVVLAPTIEVKRRGWAVSWSRAVGDSGTERCRSTFDEKGALATFDCTLEYVTHSMGPENSRVVTRVVRTYDETGALKKVTGRTTTRRVRDSTQVEDRKISSPTDEQLSDLSKPLLRLDASLRPPG